MGLRKKFRDFRDWCPQPPGRLPTKLKRHAMPIAAMALVTLVLSVSLFVSYTSLMSNPSVAIVSLVNAPSSTAPTLLWNFSAGGGAVAVESSVVYGSSGSYVYALNASDGSLLWNNSEGWGFGGVVVADGEVFTTGFTNGLIYTPGGLCSAYVIAINGKTGNTTWLGNGVFGFMPDYNTPVVASGMVYGSGNVVGMFAMNAKTGKGTWSFTGDGDISNALGMWSSPVVANGRVYIAAGEGIYVLKADNGVELWNSTIAQFWGASPVVANGVIYAGSSDGNVYALNANNGDKLWNYTTGPSMFQFGVDVLAYSSSQDGNLAGVLYAYSQNGGLYALNATSGEKLWNQVVPINTPPGYSFNPQNPVVADNVVYVGSGDGNIYAFDAANGNKLWNYTMESASDSNTTVSTSNVVNGVLYVSAGNSVYALRVSSALSSSPALFSTLTITISVATMASIVVVTAVVLMLRKKSKFGVKNGFA